MKNLRSGFPLLVQQYKALFWKNLLLSWRNKRATFLQLFASFFFFVLIFSVEMATEARFSSSTSSRTVTDPPPPVSPLIPPCEDKSYVKLPCLDFVWSGNQSARFRNVVAAIMTNNPGRPIPSSKVKSFRTAGEVDAWLYGNPMHCPGALHFKDINASVISYGVQTNSTALPNCGIFEDPTFKFQIPLQIAAEREIARSLIKDPKFSWVVAFKEFAHPTTEKFSAMDSVGLASFLATAMFAFVFQINFLVLEKELKLRQIPIGARFIGIPGTETEGNPRGTMVKVYWDQDESGALCISGHPDETPIPPNVEPMASLAPTSSRSPLGREGVARGVVLDPDQIINSTS